MGFLHAATALPVCWASQSASFPASAINTENVFYCKTHREIVILFYFFSLIIAWDAFSLLSPTEFKGKQPQACLYIDSCILHIMLALHFFARSQCWENGEGNGFLHVSVSPHVHMREKDT